VLKKEIATVSFLILVLSATMISLKADTILPEATRGASIDSLSGANSAVPPQAKKNQHGQKTDARSHRDSTLRTLLTTLAKEDSLNALSRHENGTAGVQDSRTGNFGKIIGWLTFVARRRPLLPMVAGSAVLLILLWFVLSQMTRKKTEKRFMTTTRLSLMDSEVRRACLHIEKNFAEPNLTPAGLCTAITTGEPFLEALFQRELGMSIAGYIGQVRIHHAKQLVAKNPALDGLSVASLTGFSDAVSFMTLFKKMTGTEFDRFREEKKETPA
jgi:AraC-like DNA-binding protein